jgi:hypothetical protein
MNNLVSIKKLIEFHDGAIKESFVGNKESIQKDNLWTLIENNHFFNWMLWNEEDLARRANVDASEIMKNKRAIDGYNQKRNDAIEQIDNEILSQLTHINLSEFARLNSETAGSMMDRLSILSLKLNATFLQTKRDNVSSSHIDVCLHRLKVLTEQRSDLLFCLDNLLQEYLEGKSYFKVYRQYKMYNDPAFNVYLENSLQNLSSI